MTGKGRDDSASWGLRLVGVVRVGEGEGEGGEGGEGIGRDHERARHASYQGLVRSLGDVGTG